MKKRILAFLLAVSIAVSVLVLPVYGSADGYHSGRCAHRSGAWRQRYPRCLC